MYKSRNKTICYPDMPSVKLKRYSLEYRINQGKLSQGKLHSFPQETATAWTHQEMAGETITKGGMAHTASVPFGMVWLWFECVPQRLMCWRLGPLCSNVRGTKLVRSGRSQGALPTEEIFCETLTSSWELFLKALFGFLYHHVIFLLAHTPAIMPSAIAWCRKECPCQNGHHIV